MACALLPFAMPDLQIVILTLAMVVKQMYRLT
jgi:hypothetical protein